MRIISIKTPSEEHIGFVDGDEVIDPKRGRQPNPAQFGRLAKGKEWRFDRAAANSPFRAPAKARQALSQIEFGLPVARPSKVLCLGLNYMRHVNEGRYADEVPQTSDSISSLLDFTCTA